MKAVVNYFQKFFECPPEDIQKISENNSQPLSHPISLGVIPTISPFLMPYAIKSLSAKFPKLNLNISEGQSNDLIDKVKNGDLDMAILALPFKLQGLIPIKFWAEDFFWITKKNDARSKENEIKAFISFSLERASFFLVIQKKSSAQNFIGIRP